MLVIGFNAALTLPLGGAITLLDNNCRDSLGTTFFYIPVGKRTFGPGGSELRGHRSPAGRAAPWAQEDDRPPDLDGGREGQAGLRGGGAQASYPKQGYPGARPRAALTHLPHNLLSGCKALYARLS